MVAPGKFIGDLSGNKIGYVHDPPGVIRPDGRQAQYLFQQAQQEQQRLQRERAAAASSREPGDRNKNAKDDWGVLYRGLVEQGNSKGHTDTDIESLIRQHPEQIHRWEASTNETPFLFAVKTSNLHAIQLMVQGKVSSLSSNDYNDKESSFLHQAVCSPRIKVPEAVLECLFQLDPASIGKRNERGDLPLHTAVRSARQEWKTQEEHKGAPCTRVHSEAPSNLQGAIQWLGQKYPEAMCTPNHDGNLPTHVACQFMGGAPDTLVKLLETLSSIEDSKQSCWLTQNRKGRTPLLEACSYGQDMRTNKFKRSFTFLVQKCGGETAARMTNPKADHLLPLQQLLIESMESQSFNVLYEVNPSALDNKNYPCLLQKLLMHGWEKRNGFQELKSYGIRWALTKAPYLVREKDDRGCLPLHVAVEQNRSHQVLATLVRGFPGALQARDRRGRRPVDCSTQQNGFMKFLTNDVPQRLLSSRDSIQQAINKEKSCLKSPFCSEKKVRQRLWYYQQLLLSY